MFNPRNLLFIVAIVAGVVCGRSLHAEDCGCGESVVTPMDAVYITNDGYDADGIKRIYGPEEVQTQYIPFEFLNGPALEPTVDIVINNPYDYARWDRGVYPHRYDTGMGLGGAPGTTDAGYCFVYGVGAIDHNGEPVGIGAGGGGGMGGGSPMDAGIGSSPGSGASGPGAGIGH